ncbi:MAG: hypothetical protein SFU99_10025 [Saprospiraceae bacterium]|nr:hypothetical protein [Saprospiraceae bacterium]
MEETRIITWPAWRKITFRFFFIYFLLFTQPWTWLDSIPGVSYITQYGSTLETWVVQFFNRYLLHVKDEVAPVFNGSGDTSYSWATLYTHLLLAFIGCMIWSIIDRKNINYIKIDFWLRNIVRYYVSLVAFIYGTIKLFALQMPFPNLSQLATPLGDYLPMRFSWMFIGYSFSYQFFSGLMETIVGILLLNRKTVLLGALMGMGVFANVAMMNLSYDIPVKIYSLQLFVSCIFLVLNDSKRVINFFILNKSTEPDRSYDIILNKKWQRIARILGKVAFIILFAIMPFYNSWNRYKMVKSQSDVKPIKSGIYDIVTFVRNHDTIPPLVTDTLHWKDMIFDKGGMGSINTTDTLFRQRYRRGYFYYQPDTTKQIITIKKTPADTAALFTMKYEMPGEDRMRLWTVVRGDSLYLELVRSKRHFQLAERQFHWLSEENR